MSRPPQKRFNRAGPCPQSDYLGTALCSGDPQRLKRPRPSMDANELDSLTNPYCLHDDSSGKARSFPRLEVPACFVNPDLTNGLPSVYFGIDSEYLDLNYSSNLDSPSGYQHFAMKDFCSGGLKNGWNKTGLENPGSLHVNLMFDESACNHITGETPPNMWDSVVEGNGSDGSYDVCWDQVLEDLLLENNSSPLVDDFILGGNQFPEGTQFGTESHFHGRTNYFSQYPWRPMHTFSYGNEPDLAYAPEEGPFVTPSCKSDETGPRLLGRSDDQHYQFNSDILARRTEASETQNPGGIEMKSASGHAVIFEPTRLCWERTYEEASDKRVGGRQGRLDPEVARKATEMRKIRACLRCRISKTPCSEGPMCDRCKNSNTPLSRSLCVREHLPDYLELFFPPWLNAYLQKDTVRALIRDNVAGFSDNEIEVHLSSGPTYPTIPLLGLEFRPKNPNFLAIPQLVPDENGNQAPAIVHRYALPLALSESAIKDLRRRCIDNIKSIVEGPRNPGEWKYGETSIISWRIFQAVDWYRRATQIPGRTSLLYDAVMLYAMHYFINETLLFTEETAEEALRSLLSPALLPYNRDLSPKLINRQVKYEIYLLLREKTDDVLQGLEKELMKSKKAYWGNCFCTIILLCMCAEMVQVAADLKVVHELRSNQPNPNLTREASVGACTKLDIMPIRQSMIMFHAIYRSHKQNSRHKLERAFNPLRDGIQIDAEGGVDKPMLELVSQIRSIVETLDDKLRERDMEPSFDDGPDLLANHMAFRRANSGRLVAKFLRSFW